MLKIKSALAVIVTVITLSFTSACTPAAVGQITIRDAWVRASEYSAEAGGMTGIFAEITNTTSEDVTLLGGATSAAMMVETHEVADGTMQMKQGGIVIKAGETVTLEPGGLHIMLMNLSAPIVAGDVIDFTFKFDSAPEQTFTLTAKTSAGGDETYSGK